jgi:hypothetical protein
VETGLLKTRQADNISFASTNDMSFSLGFFFKKIRGE